MGSFRFNSTGGSTAVSVSGVIITKQKKTIVSFSKMSEYAAAQRSALKLKGSGDISAGKKKKKKDKQSKHRLEQVVTSQNDEEVKSKKAYMDKRTPAQIAFDKMQEKRQMERILNKASKTHKHRVEDFNRHLDNLTEHYDIPKVSWTK